MEKGSMRLEANISLLAEDPSTSLRTGRVLPDYKVELKNINSFRFIQKAIAAETKRQSEILERHEKVPQETRGYDEDTDRTFSQRSKEEAKDYRYFPEPDIPPIKLTHEEVEKLRSEIPEMPWDKLVRFAKIMPLNYAEILSQDFARANYFETALELSQKQNISAKEVAGVMVNQNLDKKYPEPAGLVKRLLEIQNVDYATESEVEEAIKEVVFEEEKAVADFKSGKSQVMGFIIGQVQKKLKGKGNIENVRKLLLSYMGHEQ
jgi:aspartyl-tRNA(Asn)/glutamyl-tRNA(Gln) amidotransferase subunit B